MLAALWAQDETGLIGKDKTLPWHLPSDLQYFKKMTIGKTIVMGRTTFEGMGCRALPNRETIVLTRNQDYQHSDVTVMHSKEEVLALAKTSEEPIMIIGGTVVFEEFLPDTDILYCTRIDETFEGDTYFPEVNWDEWELTDVQEGTVDEQNKYAHRYETYKRKK